MAPSSFDGLTEKFERNIHGTLKGMLRIRLILQDLIDFCPPFSAGKLSILDIGGGSGRFARICAEHGHEVVLCDTSSDMLERAMAANREAGTGSITVRHADFLEPACRFEATFDLVLMHGSAEWMDDPDAAVGKACSCVRPGGTLSLLIFNRDRYLLKRGINGQLLDPAALARRNKLTPPGARSPLETASLLSSRAGTMILQSGIRIFHGFFRQVDQGILSPEQWLEQEQLFYRHPPFSALGEHTHFLWKRG